MFGIGPMSIGVWGINPLYEESFTISHTYFLRLAVHKHGDRGLQKWRYAIREKAREKVAWRRGWPDCLGTPILAPK